MAAAVGPWSVPGARSFGASCGGYESCMPEPDAGRSHSLGDSLHDFADQVKKLARAEIDLARQEMTGQTRELGLAGGMAGAAAALGALSAGTATAGLVLLLSRRTPPWLAAFTVSGGYAGAAVLLGLKARQRVEEVGVPAPDQAVEILKDTAQRVTGA